MPQKTEREDPEPEVPKTYKFGKHHYKAIPNPQNTGLIIYEKGTAREARNADERFTHLAGEIWTRDVYIFNEQGAQRKLPRYIPRWYQTSLPNDKIVNHLKVRLTLHHRDLELHELRTTAVLWRAYQDFPRRISPEVHHLILDLQSRIEATRRYLESDEFTQEELAAFDYDGRYSETENWAGPAIGADRTEELEDLLSKLLRF
jgi:hypothetical protein